jgi:hypothetical protein
MTIASPWGAPKKRKRTKKKAAPKKKATRKPAKKKASKAKRTKKKAAPKKKATKKTAPKKAGKRTRTGQWTPRSRKKLEPGSLDRLEFPRGFPKLDSHAHYEALNAVAHTCDAPGGCAWTVYPQSHKEPITSTLVRVRRCHQHKKRATKKATKKDKKFSRAEEDAALGDPTSMTMAKYRAVMLSMAPYLRFIPATGAKITKASLDSYWKKEKKKHDHRKKHGRDFKEPPTPRGWRKERGYRNVHYFHPNDYIKITDSDEEGGGSRFLVCVRNTTGRSPKTEWLCTGFPKWKDALARVKVIAKQKPPIHRIVVTKKQLESLAHGMGGMVTFKDRDYWLTRAEPDLLFARVGGKSKKHREAVFIRADSEHDPRYGHGPDWIPGAHKSVGGEFGRLSR